MFGRECYPGFCLQRPINGTLRVCLSPFVFFVSEICISACVTCAYASKQVCMDGFVCLSVRLFVCLFVCIITVPMYLPTHGNVLGTFVLCKSCVSHAHTYTMHVNLVFM